MADVISDSTFTAKQAYECLISVPFNPAVASRFIKYYNDTIQIHTTLAYLKNPPAGYQQPASDILKGLEDIQNSIDQGAFPNQYAFEATLQSLIYSAHDVHLYVDIGILAVFDFQTPYSIVSLSEDGIQDPKLYLTGTASVLLAIVASTDRDSRCFSVTILGLDIQAISHSDYQR